MTAAHTCTVVWPGAGGNEASREGSAVGVRAHLLRRPARAGPWRGARATWPAPQRGRPAAPARGRTAAGTGAGASPAPGPSAAHGQADTRPTREWRRCDRPVRGSVRVRKGCFSSRQGQRGNHLHEAAGADALAEERAAHAGVHGAERVVQQHHVGLAVGGARQRQPGLLPPRELRTTGGQCAQRSALGTLWRRSGCSSARGRGAERGTRARLRGTLTLMPRSPSSVWSPAGRPAMSGSRAQALSTCPARTQSRRAHASPIKDTDHPRGSEALLSQSRSHLLVPLLLVALPKQHVVPHGARHHPRQLRASAGDDATRPARAQFAKTTPQTGEVPLTWAQ